MRRLIGTTTATLLLLASVVVLAQTPAGASDGVADYYARINAARAAAGVAPLHVDAGLAAGAQSWAGTMASQGTIFHSSFSSWFPSWAGSAGENVGTGPSDQTVFSAFMGSSLHRANILNPAYTDVGVGVVWVGAQQYTVQRFAARSGATPPPTSPPATAPPATAPPATAPPATAAPVTAPPATASPTTAAPVVAPSAASGTSGHAADPGRVAEVLVAIRAIDG